jgi:tetratricopeptide (TPR) repeat protein
VKNDEAIERLTEALDLKQLLLGTDTASVAETQQTLAEAYFHNQQYLEAIPHAQEAVRIRELLGDERLLNVARRVLQIIESKASETETASDA